MTNDNTNMEGISSYKILILYNYPISPPRKTIWDHLYSFKNYSNNKCFYLNTALGNIPSYIMKIQFDIVIFHTTFLSKRSDLAAFQKLLAKSERLKTIKAIKIALPQDEFMNTRPLCDFLKEFGIDYVFSVAPESEWKKIYTDVDFERVKFYNILTGYLDCETIDKINRLAEGHVERTIDIGYRAWRAAPWLGRHGYLKKIIADVFEKKASEAGLKVDISTRDEDTFFGDEWYKFLLKCKYTIGVEGGASILDKDGTIKAKTDRYMKENPNASYEEIESACFAGLDGTLNLFAISPRHLEACATRTCQILVKGSYNGILIPMKHYIEINPDLSNLDKVLDIVKEDRLRLEIVDNAYRDIVESQNYTYQSMVRFILSKSEIAIDKYQKREFDNMDKIIYYLTIFRDNFSWIKFYLLNLILKLLRNILPVNLIESLIKIYKRI